MNTVQIMQTRAPTLVPNPTDTRLLNLVTLAEGRTSQSAFGDHYEEAVALRVLHILTKDAMQTTISSGGAISSQSEGQLSQTTAHAPTTQADEDLASTAFGKELLALRRACILGARTRIR